MIRIQELKAGDYVIVDNQGDRKRGEVVELNVGSKQVCVNNGVQEFWYEVEQLSPIPINEEHLSQLQFHKQVNDDGTVKYSKGAFRMLLPQEGDFSRMELWYRDERRHITQHIYLHQLQNHFYEMTKVHLNDTNFD